MGGILLDIGCGDSKPEGYTGMDKRALPGVDIVHDWNAYPWPLDGGACARVRASHVVEHVNPADGGFLRWMDEAWRILQAGGELEISCPHGWSAWYLQDPTHCNQVNEHTWFYFDPAFKYYDVYRPRPWRIESLQWDAATVIDVLLVKREDQWTNG